MEIEGAPAFDVLAVGGAAEPGRDARARRRCAPAAGDELPILTAGTLGGLFAGVTGGRAPLQARRRRGHAALPFPAAAATSARRADGLADPHRHGLADRHSLTDRNRHRFADRHRFAHRHGTPAADALAHATHRLRHRSRSPPPDIVTLPTARAASPSAHFSSA